MRILLFGLLIFSLSACNLNNSPADAEVTQEAQQATSLTYYIFSTETDVPTGSINLAGIILVPISITSQSSNVNDALQETLELAINDSHNLWTSENLAFSVTFDDGHAVVAFIGQISGTGGLVLTAASSQLLLTVFANPNVETAVVSLNAENIENLGISHSSQAKPADYLYTREEIQAFITTNAAQS